MPAGDPRIEHDFAAEQARVDAIANLTNDPSDVAAKRVRVIEAKVGQPVADKQIEPVDRTRVDLDDDLAGLRPRGRLLAELQDLGPTVVLEDDRLHGRAAVAVVVRHQCSGSSRSAYPWPSIRSSRACVRKPLPA